MSLPFCSRSVKVAMLIMAFAAPGGAQAHPDFSGVWKIASDQTALTTTEGKTPPLLPGPLAAYQATSARRAAGDLSWDGVHKKCKPPGEPRILLEQMPFEIVQQKDKLFYSYQWNRLDRFVFIDKPLSVIAPTYFSTSVAKWQGDTLVIDSEGYNDKTFLDRDGMPHSTQLKLIERLSLSPDHNTLRERITVEDPATFSKPWDTMLRFVRQPDHIEEDVCEVREGLFKE